jgi:hypothetical protein
MLIARYDSVVLSATALSFKRRPCVSLQAAIGMVVAGTRFPRARTRAHGLQKFPLPRACFVKNLCISGAFRCPGRESERSLFDAIRQHGVGSSPHTCLARTTAGSSARASCL